MRFDMHCHTKEGSIDSRISVSEYIQKYSELGYDGFMITDHNSYRGCRQLLRLKKSGEYDPGDFTVLCGVEYDTKDAGHVIVVMPDGLLSPLLTIRGMRCKKLANFVHLHGGILGPAHPYGVPSTSAMGFKLMKLEYLECFDFIEGFNTCESESSNRYALELADSYGLPVFAGTDAHNNEYLGMACTDIDYEVRCNNDLIQAVKCGAAIRASGVERGETAKGRAKESLLSQIGYRIYNRGLGKLNMIRRKYTHYKIIDRLLSDDRVRLKIVKDRAADTESADTELHLPYNNR